MKSLHINQKHAIKQRCKKSIGLFVMINGLFLFQDGSLAQVFMVAEGFNWSYLVSNNYCEVTNWLLQHCDPACILSERSSISALGPRYNYNKDIFVKHHRFSRSFFNKLFLYLIFV